MVSLSLYPQFETNFMSNRKVIELLLQLKSAKAHGKNYIKVKPHLVRHFLRNRLFQLINVRLSWISLGLLMNCTFCYLSRSGALFKSQSLILIRTEPLNVNFNVGLNKC